jgi:short-subunit dehydrogenase
VAKSIAVFGAGPGLGRAVARRYAQAGYDVVLVGRRRQPLDEFSQALTASGFNAHAISADLADLDAIPALAERIRGTVGELDALYYAPTPDHGFVAATELTPQSAQEYMPLIYYSVVALVRQFLPHMIGQSSGAILTAQGASTVSGLAYLSGSGPAQAAQRNYLQSLHLEVADQGVYVGMLYVGALIEDSAFHTQTEHAKAAGVGRDWGPTVSPTYLADVLWEMHRTKSPMETIYPK